ncbi:MAG: terminase large subunit [Chloroflexi bacterium]|nr:MAG: terminase large subunit [Chloroflexota bacterium]
MMELNAEAYVDDVLDGKIPACRWVRLACERHRRDLETGHERGLFFDERAAVQALAAFPTLMRHWKGEWAGRPLVLEPAQQFWVWSLFGWKREDGTRRFRTAYLEVGRKNGKTVIAAGVGLYLAFLDGEPGAEVYSAATTRDQAKISHRDATEMVRRGPLSQYIGIYRDNLHELTSGSKFEPLSSDYNSLDGLNIHGVIADELHAWPQRDLWGVLKTGTGARRQPLTLAITTAGVNQQGVCWEQREYLTRVLKGIIDDDTYWGIIYTLDMKTDWPDLEQDDDWQNETNWIKANPLMGVSKKIETMRQDAHEAANNPAALNSFLRWHLNIWTQAQTRWINPVQWAACGEYVVDEEELAGRVCYGGLDLSQRYDITAFALVFPPVREGEPYQAICRMWIPEENVYDRVVRDRVPYDVWIRQAWLQTTPGNVVDYDFILAEIERLRQRYSIQEIGFDRWGMALVTQRLQEMGGDDWVVPIGQGYASMSAPMKELGVMIASKRLAHGNNPVLNWMADNLVAAEDAAGNIKPDKGKAREKIDGMVALIMALDRATRNYGGGSSVYEERDLIIL